MQEAVALAVFLATRLWRALASRFPWLSITPLGRPVVPPVYEMVASVWSGTSGGATGGAVTSSS